MMKNEDLKKLSNEENRGSPKLRIKISHISFLLVLIPTLLSGQAFVNEFVYYEEVKTISGSNKVFSMFIDQDDKSDFLVLGNSSAAAVHLSSNNYKFKTAKLPYEFSDIKKLSGDGKSVTCLFVSRSDRIVGLIKLFTDGKYKILDRIKLDSFPSKCSVYQRGAKTFALLFGENFNGLDLIIIENNILNNLKLVEKTLVQNAEFADVDYDGYIDIVYSDLIYNEIRFLTNNLTGGFDLIRTLHFNEILQAFSIIDYNFDGYIDFIYQYPDKIEVCLGDSVSSFYKSSTIIRDSSIDQYFLSDFNKDGYYDLTYKSGNHVEIGFSDNGFLITEPVRYFGNENITAINKSGNYPGSLVVLTDNILKIISTKKENKNQQVIKVGIKPQEIFIYNNDENSRGLFVLDSVDRKLILLNENFSRYYSCPVIQYFTELRYSKKGDNVIFVYLFNKGKKLIELIKLNLDTGNYSSTLIYTQQIIAELVIDDASVYQAFPDIYILSNENGMLSYVEYFYKDIRYLASNPVLISGQLNDFGVNKNLFVFYSEQNSTSLRSFNLSDSGEKEIKPDINTKKMDKLSIESFVNQKNENIVILREGKYLYLLFNGITREAKSLSQFDSNIKKVFYAAGNRMRSYLFTLTSDSELFKVGPLESSNFNYEVQKIAAGVTDKFIVDYYRGDQELIYNLDTNKNYTKLIWPE